MPGTVTSDIDNMYGASTHCGELSLTSMTFTLTGMTKLYKYYRMIERKGKKNYMYSCFFIIILESFESFEYSDRKLKKKQQPHTFKHIHNTRNNNSNDSCGHRMR